LPPGCGFGKGLSGGRFGDRPSREPAAFPKVSPQ
jgi:hypothetical protein